MRFTRDILDLAGRRVTVMGLGAFGGGEAVARFLVRAGAKVTVTDLKTERQLADVVARLHGLPVTWRLGEHREEDFARADLVVVNPAVPDDSPFLRAAAEAGVPLETEINLLWKLCPARRRIGVTGSNGKTTTVALLGAALAALELPVHVGGNIGGSLLDRLDGIGADDTVVLELSSFQLERLAALSPRPTVGVITNLTPNHLDRHGTMDAYRAAKACLIRHQTRDEAKVLNAANEGSKPYLGCGDGRTLRFARDLPDPRGVEILPEGLEIRLTGSRWRLDLRGRKLPGPYHLENMAAAAAAVAALTRGRVADWAGRVERAFREFPGVPHRLELVGEVRGVRWYNDSIATTPEATMAALAAVEGPIVLILGGSDKKLPFDSMARAVVARGVAAVVLVGRTAAAIREALSRAGYGGPMDAAGTFDDALAAAAARAGRGAAVLLSPASASYDMFRNFEERGGRFREWVRRHGNP